MLIALKTFDIEYSFFYKIFITQIHCFMKYIHIHNIMSANMAFCFENQNVGKDKDSNCCFMKNYIVYKPCQNKI